MAPKKPTPADAPADSPDDEVTQYKTQLAKDINTMIDAGAKILFTADMAETAIKRWDEIHDFELTATHPGAFARVRMVDLSDGVMMNSLPDTLLERVLNVAKDINTSGDEPPVVSEDGRIDLQRAKRNVERQAAICDAYCLAGFVEPALIVTEAERENAAQVLLRAIHPADRQRFFQWCQGQHAEATATAADFPAA